MTTQTLQAIVGVFTSVIIPFVISQITTLKWTDLQKFALLVGLSVVGGTLNVAMETGIHLSNSDSIVNTILAIFAGAISVYRIFFKGLGFEKVIDPKEALASEGAKQVKQDVQKLTTETAKAVLDPSSPPNILVQTSIV